MSVHLNHTVVAAGDAEATARWFAEILGLDEPVPFGPFWQITTGNGVNLDFHTGYETPEVTSQHYAFLVSEEEFDAIFGRIVEGAVDYFADPMGRQAGEINHNDGGRGVYFPDPNGHWLEIITRPYGGAPVSQ